MKKTEKGLARCHWAKSELNIPYHDEEWGVPVHDEHKWFEFLILEGAQAGLSWDTILRKRSRYREVFDGFDPEKVARYDKKKVQELLRDAGIIRNRLKIEPYWQRARVSRSPERIRHVRCVHLALRRRPAQTKRVEDSQTHPSENARIRRSQQRPEEARISVCWINYLLCADARHGDGERSSAELFSVQGNN